MDLGFGHDKPKGSCRLRSAPLVGTPLTSKKSWQRWLQVHGWRFSPSCFGSAPWWLRENRHRFGEKHCRGNKNPFLRIGPRRSRKMFRSTSREFPGDELSDTLIYFAQPVGSTIWALHDCTGSLNRWIMFRCCLFAAQHVYMSMLYAPVVTCLVVCIHALLFLCIKFPVGCSLDIFSASEEFQRGNLLAERGSHCSAAL